MAEYRIDSDLALNALVIEDNAEDAAYIRNIAEEVLSVQFSTISSIFENRAALEESLYDLVLLNLSASGRRDIRTVRKVAGKFPDIPVIVMTGHENDPTELWEAGGVGDFLAKDGLTPAMLRQTVLSAIERHRSKRDLEAGRIDFMQMIERHPDANILVEGGVIRYANSAAADLFGRSAEALEGTPFELSAASDIDILRPDGSLRVAEVRFAKLSAVGGDARLIVLRDAHRERRDRLAVRQTQQSYLLYQSVKYLLHAMNNPIGALLSHLKTAHRKFDRIFKSLILRPEEADAEFALRQSADFLPLAEAVKKSLICAQAACLSLESSVSVLGRTRPVVQNEAPVSTSLFAELDSAIDIAMQNFFGNAIVKRNYGALPRTAAQPLCLAEVFCAVVQNALEAVSGREGGEVAVYGAVSDGTVRVRIEDNGPGVPEDLKEKIFMPFFSTRRQKNAVGLGLTLAQDAVKRLGGDILVDRCALGGACFTVYLPSEDAALSAQSAPEEVWGRLSSK